MGIALAKYAHESSIQKDIKVNRTRARLPEKYSGRKFTM